MSEEKCFCHLGEYAVKDATARKDIEELKKVTSVDNIQHIDEGQLLYVDGKWMRATTKRLEDKDGKLIKTLSVTEQIPIQPGNGITLSHSKDHKEITINLSDDATGGFMPTYMDIGMSVDQMYMDEFGIHYQSTGNELSDDNDVMVDCSQNIKLPITAGAGIEFVDEGGKVSINNTFSNIPLEVRPGDSFEDYLTTDGYYHMIVRCQPENPHTTGGDVVEFPDDGDNQEISIPGGMYHAYHFMGKIYFTPLEALNNTKYCVYANHVLGSGIIFGQAMCYGYDF